MTNRLTLGSVFLFLAIGMMLVSGCDRTPIEDDHFDHVERVEVRERGGENTLYAFFETGQSDLGFQGPGVPPLQVGAGTALNVHFIDAVGNEAALGTNLEYEVRADIVGDTGIIEVSNHGDHIDIDALAEGETHIVFHLWHGNHPDFTTPPLEIEVEDR